MSGSAAYPLNLDNARTFGNLTFSKSTGTGSYTSTGASQLTLNGNLTINSGANFSPTFDNNLNIKGNLVIDGTFGWNPSDATGTENLIFSGTTQTISGSGTWNLGANIDAVNIQNGASVTLSKDLTLASTNILDVDAGGLLSISNTNCINHSASQLTNDGTITVQNGASLVTRFSGTAITGTGTYKIIKIGSNSNAYNFWSSPLTNQNVSLVGNPVYQYNETNNDPTDFRNDYAAASGTMTTARGYAGWNGATVTFSGTGLITGTQTINITATGTIAGLQDGWNLIGNPYTAAIDIAGFLTDNSIQLSNQAVYFWSDDNSGGTGYASSDYAVYNTVGSAGGGGITPAGYIPSCQGFVVKCGGTSAPSTRTITFNPNRQVCTNAQFFRTEPIEGVKLAIYDSSKRISSTLVAFLEDATDTFDIAYDAIANPGGGLIATLNSGARYSIEAYSPLKKRLVIPISLKLPLEGRFYFKAEHILVPKGYKAYLFDGQDSTELNPTERYWFNLENPQNDDRFSLHFVPLADQGPTALQPDAKGFQIHSHQDKIYLRFEEQTRAQVEVIDVQGRAVRSYQTQEQNLVLKTGLSGMYLVKVSHSKGSYSTKLWFD